MMISLIRTIILYFFITIAVRLMGKRQISDMQPNELVVTLLISEIAAIPLQDPARPLLEGVVAIFILVVMEIIMSVFPMKSTLIRKWISGNAVIIIRDGVIDQNAMKKVRMTVLDLIELLRIQNVFDLTTVAFAVLEVNGSLSVLLKNEETPATKKDIGVKSSPTNMLLPIITDGKMITESIDALKLNDGKIQKRLSGKTRKEVFLMTSDKYGNGLTVLKEQNK